MIDVRAEDVVAERRTADGRFILFTKTDVQPDWSLPWWGAVSDVGGDAFGLLVRLDELAAPAGWTARQLLLVVQRRLMAEAERLPILPTHAALASLRLAIATGLERTTPARNPAQGLSYRPGGCASPYPWAVATQGDFDLPLCPDPESREEGITPEQLLIIIDQLLRDAARLLFYPTDLWRARGHVSAALAAETSRLAAVRV